MIAAASLADRERSPSPQDHVIAGDTPATDDPRPGSSLQVATI
jgi:hypothetical protein